MKPCDIVFRHPGETTRATMRYECICVIFSFNGFVPKAEFYPLNKDKSIQATFFNPWIETLPSVTESLAEGAIRPLFDGIMRAFINPSPFSSLATKTYLLEILSRCLNASLVGNLPDDRDV